MANQITVFGADDELPDAPKFSGLMTSVPAEVYHRQPHISKSKLDLVERSPAHFKAERPESSSAAMELGTALHMAILQPALFDENYTLVMEKPDKRTAAYKELVKANYGRTIISGDDAQAIVGMRASYRASERVQAIMAGYSGLAEVSLFQEFHGVDCKCRFDAVILPEDKGEATIIDLKTTRDARPRPFSNTINEYRYHVQAAFYTDMLSQYLTNFGKKPRVNFVFLAIENTPPYPSVPYVLTDLDLQIGRTEYVANLQRYKWCAEHDEWPAYPEADALYELISLPEWRLNLYEMEQMG